MEKTKRQTSELNSTWKTKLPSSNRKNDFRDLCFIEGNTRNKYILQFDINVKIATLVNLTYFFSTKFKRF